MQLECHPREWPGFCLGNLGQKCRSEAARLTQRVWEAVLRTTASRQSALSWCATNAL